MTPAARIAAAAEVLDRWIAGEPAERALTNWGRAARYAGSGDRAAVRDHVFRAIRRFRSQSALGGAGDGTATGRQLLIGGLRADGVDPAAVFTGGGHAPAPLTAAESAALGAAPGPEDLSGNVARDLPDWLEAPLRESLGEAFDASVSSLRDRAPVFCRINGLRSDPATAVSALAAEGVVARTVDGTPGALEVVSGGSRIRQSGAWRAGLVELQDAGSQAAALTIPATPGMRILDYCAGGGGKTLALAGRVKARFFAHDADAGRMRDLPERAARAGVTVTYLAPGAALGAGPFDLVVADVPCSGSGAWRRAPEGKWALTPSRLAALIAAQDMILDAAGACTGPGGVLSYLTCSLLRAENEDRIAAFCGRYPGWHVTAEARFPPGGPGDGFFAAHLTRE